MTALWVRPTNPTVDVGAEENDNRTLRVGARSMLQPSARGVNRGVAPSSCAELVNTLVRGRTRVSLEESRLET